MALYDPTGHPRLIDEAPTETDLTAVADEAEMLLGLDDTEFTGADAEKAKLAVVRQVNKLVRLDLREDAEVTEESKGDQSLTYARRKDGGVEVMDEQAVRMVAELKAKATAAEAGPPALPTSQSTPIQFSW